MKYRILGKTGFNISEISLGTWQLGGKWGEKFNEKGEMKMQRYGMVIKLRPEKYEEYKRLHAAVWPDVLDMIKQLEGQYVLNFFTDAGLLKRGDDAA